MTRPTSADPTSSPTANTRIERYVEWIDTDAGGIAHNSAIMRWVEACETQLMREHDLLSTFPSAPRVHQTIDFTSQLRFGQRIRVELTVQAVGTSSLTFAFAVVGEEFEGRPAATAARGTFTTVHVPLGQERSAPWPAPVKARLEAATWTTLEMLGA